MNLVCHAISQPVSCMGFLVRGRKISHLPACRDGWTGDLYVEGEKKMPEDFYFVNKLSSYLASHKYMHDSDLPGKFCRPQGVLVLDGASGGHLVRRSPSASMSGQ